MRNGLFIGDLDEVDFIEDFEKRFGVGFDERDYPGWLTIGDVHSSLMARLPDIEGPGGGCPSQMAFYRLRRAAGPKNSDARPMTPLDALGLGKPGKTLRQLSRCGLETPAPHGSLLSGLAGMAMIGAAFCIVIAALSGNGEIGRWSAATIVATAALLRVPPVRYPGKIETLADLAQHVAHTNAMILKAQGAGLRQGEIWLSLRALAADNSGIAEEEISPEMPFIKQKAKRYADRA